MAADAPKWLLAAFPGYQWQKVRRCELKVRPQGGAGLQFEATEFGYLIEGVENDAGQDACLQTGSSVISINDVPLMGLDEDALNETFGKNFRDGAKVVVLSSGELQKASEQANGQGHIAHVPLGCQCTAELRSGLSRDLDEFSRRSGVLAELCGAESSESATIVLAGTRDKVCAARSELGALLSYHKRTFGAAETGSAEDESATVEVAGTIMRSLPARNRRKRAAPEVDPDEEENGANDSSAKGDDDGSGPAEKVAKVGSGLEPKMPEQHQYEYMDHTADVILHSWGSTLNEAIGQVCVAFFSYMTELEKIELETSFEVEAKGHDMLDMIYHLLDEFLFHFGTEFIMCRRVDILEFDPDNFSIRARGFGEKFDLAKHPQGTEIKAITMHQMKILTPETLTTEEGVIPRTSDLMEGGSVREGFPYECYVLVDI